MDKIKKTTGLLLALLLVLLLAACSNGTTAGNTGGNSNNSDDSAANPISVDYDSEDLDGSTSEDATYVDLKGDSISVSGEGVTVEGNKVTVKAAGQYSFSGNLNNGQLMVDTDDEETVRLVLDGVDITCTTSAPIYILNADKVIITLAEGSKNYVTDGDSYILEDPESDEPNAAIFSNDDLTINGEGMLTVNASYNHGIVSKDDLKITGGNINITAANDGIKGRDSIAIKDGNITIDAGGDGMQSNNDEDSEKGYIAIEGGTINISASQDGIQAETNLSVSGASITVTTGGGNANGSSRSGWGIWGTGVDTESAKGLKAGINITISGGTFDIDSSDDSIHSNDTIVINGGYINIASGDDAIHADSNIEINSGDIRISKCYEGIESAIVKINDGSIRLVSSDDGINIVGGADGSGFGRPGQGDFSVSDDYYLSINGGYVFINSGGDGLDANGYIEMTDGVVLINGPTANNNGALDYYGSFKMSGGFLVAVGSAGMAEATSTDSSQYAVSITYSSTQAAGTIIHIETGDGKEILTFAPQKAYQSVVLCSPELENGESYVLSSGGSYSDTATDGLYSGGQYNGGTQITSFTISSILTNVGSYSGGGFPGPGGRP